MSNTSSESLRASLQESLSRVIPDGLQFGRPELMQSQVESIRSRFNVLGETTIQKDRMREAIRTFLRGGAESLDEICLFFICWGLVDECEGFKLIEGNNFTQLLSRLDRHMMERRLLSFSWRGLLTGYFQYDPSISSESRLADSERGRRNWHLLREFLFKSFPDILRGSRYPLPWVETLNSNLNLLQTNPCQKYAHAVLQGDESEIQRLKNELLIPVESWFWSELILSQIDKIVGYNDNDFKGHIDKIIPRLQDNKFYKDEGLKRLLNRYYRCADKETHEGLKQFSLGVWGSPQLIRHDKWGHVNSEVKQMVQGWLVLEDLQDFFDLSRTDMKSDERRLDFWLKYIKQIQYSRIVLGNRAYSNQERDYRNLRDKKGNRLSRLLSSQDDNAFIMKIGEYYFVEFTKTGNACYGYRENSLPFQMEKPEYHLSVLKNQGAAVFREIHKDTSRLGDWEGKFARELAKLGIAPDDQRQSPPGRTSTENGVSVYPSGSSRPQTEWRKSQQNNSENELQAFLARHRFSIRDNREEGGALWVFHSVETGYIDIVEQLRRFGFTYSPRKQGYWKR